MKKNWLLCVAFIALFISSHAQKKEERFDFNFKPTKTTGRYHVVTEKQGDLWYRQAYYFPELTMAMEGWYKDEEGKIPQDTMSWYHTTRYMKSKGRYNDGKKEGVWLEYNEEGMLRDSSNYINGHLTGIGIGWHSNGMISDSTNFDGAGNGVIVKWDDEGNVVSAGRMEQDTLMKGRWQYFYANGNLLATEDYVNGKRIACECYTEKGIKQDTAICNKEKEASFPGGVNGWRRFLERTLNPQVPADNGARDGQYTVLLRFRVDKEGNIQDLKAITNYGYGLEEESLRVLKLSPRWEPAMQFGRNVNAYRLQPLTFVVSSQ